MKENEAVKLALQNAGFQNGYYGLSYRLSPSRDLLIPIMFTQSFDRILFFIEANQLEFQRFSVWSKYSKLYEKLNASSKLFLSR